MFPTPKSALTPNTYAYESSPLVKPTGFREYDARWLLEKEINLMGVQALGMGLGTLIREMGVKPEIVTGHDFRSYSASVKLALVTGLMAAGCKVHDIGLAITPMAYFAQFDLDVPCVAMVTASHNDNGWTGVKMGANRPLTFGPDEMTRLKEIVLGAKFKLDGGGSYVFVENFPERYIADLTKRPKIKRKLKVVAACGNGTAGAFAPKDAGGDRLRGGAARLRARPHLPALQSEPRRHEDAARHARRGAGAQGRRRRSASTATATAAASSTTTGEEIFADKVGVMLARDMSSLHPGATFVVDVKSTGLFMHRSGAAEANGVKADYWKTGHSYIKRRVNELGALAGFEKSGHFFFNKPFGRGYDDGMIFGAGGLRHARPQSRTRRMADLRKALPKTWGSPTMSPHCDDEKKYGVVDAVVKHFQDAKAKGEKVAGQPIRDLVTVNGVRVTVEDGTWGLVRASSNKPELVVVVESPVSEARMRDMFKAVDGVLRTHPEVGEYNQTI